MKTIRNLLATTALTFLALPTFAQTATVSTTESSLGGFNFTSAAQNASTTNYFKNDGRTLALIQNRQSATVTATVVGQTGSVTIPGFGTISLSDQTITIPSGTTMVVGPFGTNRFSSGGLTRINLTSTTLVSISTVKLPQ